MSVITAHKCDVTGELFEDRKQYTNHGRKLTRELNRKKNLEKQRLVDQQWWADNFWNRVRSLDQLKAAILYHRDVFAHNGLKNYFGSKRLLPTPLVEFLEFDIRSQPQATNYWDCPHNGVTNWGGRIEGAPTSYPGWEGWISYSVQSHKTQLWYYPGGSDMWTNTRLHTGSGSGGGAKDQEVNFLQEFGYGIRLFEADWPAMADSYEKIRMLNRLTGTSHDLDAQVNAAYPADQYLAGPEKGR